MNVEFDAILEFRARIRRDHDRPDIDIGYSVAKYFLSTSASFTTFQALSAAQSSRHHSASVNKTALVV
jgi:hypothetical protein